MLPPAFVSALEAIFPGRVRLDAPLAPLTTFRVGGPAECLVQAESSEDVLQAVRLARRHSVPVTLLGGGSNTIVSDRGVRGVVVRVHGGRIAVEQGASAPPGAEPPSTPGLPIRADAGVTMNALVRWTIGRGHAGLEAWAGTPGTVGGAIFGNAHYGGRNIGDLVASARFLAADSDAVIDLPGPRLDFSYDHSRFQDTADVLLSAVFTVLPGADPARLREAARASLAYRKRTQPLGAPSAGCIFQNPDPAQDRLPEGVPCSAGALVDRAGLKGRAIGGARVSPAHANFIVSDGTATASDIRALVRLCEAEVRRRFGVELREEVRWVGEFEE